MSEEMTFPQLSQSLVRLCAASTNSVVRMAPDWICDFLTLDQRLPSQYGWRFYDVDGFKKTIKEDMSTITLNRAFWTDQAHNVEAYSVMSIWRGAELLRPAVRSLNLDELITPAVLARSLLELSTAYVLHANDIGKTFSGIKFPADTVVLSHDFEEKVVKMIWGTRLGTPESYVRQTNVLTQIQKLSKHPNATELLPHYEYLCEIAHPNVIGNSRYWSHVECVNDDGSETRALSRTANGAHAAEIREKVIWSLAWAAESLCLSFQQIHGGIEALLSNFEKA